MISLIAVMHVYSLDDMLNDHVIESKLTEKDNKVDTNNITVWLYIYKHMLIHIYIIYNLYTVKGKVVCKKSRELVKTSKKENTLQRENHNYSHKNGPALDIHCQTMFLQIIC